MDDDWNSGYVFAFIHGRGEVTEHENMA